MKNRIFFLTSFLTITILIVFFISCDKETLKKQEFHLQNVDKMISEFNVGRNIENWALLSEGDLEIIIANDMILMKFDIPGNEEIKTYFLQIDKKDFSLKSQHFGLAEVIYLQQQIVVNSLERQQTLLFSLTKDSTPNYAKDIIFTNQFYGYGIGLNSAIRGAVTLRTPTCYCYLTSEPLQGCDSGGIGSTSCSILGTGGCSVSCGLHYYSCCNN